MNATIIKEKVNASYILLNKPFIGDYMERNELYEAHELINFHQSDQGNYYIYCNPYGQNMRGSQVNDICYLVFTTFESNNTFFIEYVFKVRALHNCVIGKKTAVDKRKEIVQQAKQQLLKSLNLTSLDEITYGGQPITKLFHDQSDTIPFTFEVLKSYQAAKPIPISTSEAFDYNFQRNYGCLKEKEKPLSYQKILNIIEDKENWKDYQAKPFHYKDEKETKFMEKNGYLDLISQYNRENAYTNILYNYLKGNPPLLKIFTQFCVDKANKESIQLGDMIDIYAEHYVKGYGRIDLYIQGEKQSVIIENKVKSDIHYSKDVEGNKECQLMKYAKLGKENFYFLLTPQYKVDYMKSEIQALGLSQTFQVLSYKDIFEFFKDYQKDLKSNLFFKYYEDVLDLLKVLSLSKVELNALKVSYNHYHFNK